MLSTGFDPARVVFAGDSAGGNLALATLLRIKQSGGPLPACAVLLSPVVDFTLSGRSVFANAKRDPVFGLAALLAMRAEYAPPELFLDPAVSPLYGDFHGLPPLFFQVGSTEMLLDESTRAAEKAHASGVPVTLEIWDRMPHVFQAVATLPQTALATDRIVRFIAVHTGWAIER
jgi:acetyl esterase/lipase